LFPVNHTAVPVLLKTYLISKKKQNKRAIQ